MARVILHLAILVLLLFSNLCFPSLPGIGIGIGIGIDISIVIDVDKDMMRLHPHNVPSSSGPTTMSYFYTSPSILVSAATAQNTGGSKYYADFLASPPFEDGSGIGQVIYEAQLRPVTPNLVGCAYDDAKCIFDKYSKNDQAQLTPSAKNGFNDRWTLLDYKNLIFCNTVDCITNFAESHSSCNNEIIYLMQISDVENSFAVAYNLPWMQYFLNMNSTVDQYFLLIESGGGVSGSSAEEKVAKFKLANDMFHAFLKYMPKCTVYCIFHCNSGQMTMNLNSIYEQRAMFGYHRTPIMHLSNENPYPQLQNSSEDVASYCYGDPVHYPETYSKYSLVVRPYYYSELDSTSLYMPLGSREFDILRYYAKPVYPSSTRRKHRCFFSGRFSYDHHRPHHYERRELKEMLSQFTRTTMVQSYGSVLKEHQVWENNTLCDTYASTDETVTYATFMYGRHVRELLKSQFCLAPAGNSPETFRVYESLEAGCIPILAHPKPEMNYITRKWAVQKSLESPRAGRFPGVVLAKWAELPLFWKTLEALDNPPSSIDMAEIFGFVQRSSLEAIDLSTSLDCNIAFSYNSSHASGYPDWISLWIERFRSKKCSTSLNHQQEPTAYNSYVDRLQGSLRDWYFDFLYQQSGLVVEKIYKAIYDDP